MCKCHDSHASVAPAVCRPLWVWLPTLLPRCSQNATLAIPTEGGAYGRIYCLLPLPLRPSRRPTQWSQSAAPATQNGPEPYTGTVMDSPSAGASPDEGLKVPRLPRRMDQDCIRTVMDSASPSASLRLSKCHACHAEWTRAAYRLLQFRLPRAPS